MNSVHKVRLENIVNCGYDNDTGDRVLNITVEFVCSDCRHLVEGGDAYCWCCGKKFDGGATTEHYQKGKQLTNESFNAIRKSLEG